MDFGLFTYVLNVLNFPVIFGKWHYNKWGIIVYDFILLLKKSVISGRMLHCVSTCLCVVRPCVCVFECLWCPRVHVSVNSYIYVLCLSTSVCQFVCVFTCLSFMRLMFVCSCVQFFVCMCACMFVCTMYAFLCVCVFVCPRVRVLLCLCVSVLVW